MADDVKRPSFQEGRSTVQRAPVTARASLYSQHGAIDVTPSSSSRGSKLRPPGIGGECLLYVAHGHNFPQAGGGATLSAWAERDIANGGTEVVGETVQWKARPGNEAPSWSISRPLGFVLIDNRDVRICMELRLPDRSVGKLSVALKDLLGEGLVTQEFLQPVGIIDAGTTKKTVKGAQFEPPTVSFQIIDQQAILHRRTVFFIRHGQSVWNKAQSNNNFYQMLKTKDHPLSTGGRDEAEALAKRIQNAESSGHANDGRILRPDVIYCSPLTRAVQTAVIALQPVFKAGKSEGEAASGEIVFMSSAREKQNLGGMDSKGSAVGVDLVKRTLEETRVLYRDREDKSVPQSFRGIRFDVEEVKEDWWTKKAKDSKGMLEERLNDFMSQLLYAPQDSVVVVGHSHFFRSVFQRYLSSDFAAKRPDFAKRLQTWKLMNCGVCRIELDPTADMPIVEAELVLDTVMIPEKKGVASKLCCLCGGSKRRGTDSE